MTSPKKTAPYHNLTVAASQELMLNRMDRLIALTKKIVNQGRATRFAPTLEEVSLTPEVEDMSNHFYDKKAVRITLNPNGTLDAPPTWTQDNPNVTMTPAGDGLSADFIGTADGPVNWSANAPADDPETPDATETVVGSGSFSFSHSKATSFAPVESEVDLPTV